MYNKKGYSFRDICILVFSVKNAPQGDTSANYQIGKILVSVNDRKYY